MHVHKVSSHISLCGLHSLIWDDTLRTCIKPCFPRAKLFSKNTIRIANSLDPDETPRSVASHLDPNCLQRPSKSGSGAQRVNLYSTLVFCVCFFSARTGVVVATQHSRTRTWLALRFHWGLSSSPRFSPKIKVC